LAAGLFVPFYDGQKRQISELYAAPSFRMFSDWFTADETAAAHSTSVPSISRRTRPSYIPRRRPALPDVSVFCTAIRQRSLVYLFRIKNLNKRCLVFLPLPLRVQLEILNPDLHFVSPAILPEFLQVFVLVIFERKTRSVRINV
jgi:hypothetical protein